MVEIIIALTTAATTIIVLLVKLHVIHGDIRDLQVNQGNPIVPDPLVNTVK